MSTFKSPVRDQSSHLLRDGEASAGSLEKKLLGSEPQGNSHEVYAKLCPFLKSSGKVRQACVGILF